MDGLKPSYTFSIFPPTTEKPCDSLPLKLLFNILSKMSSSSRRYIKTLYGRYKDPQSAVKTGNAFSKKVTLRWRRMLSFTYPIQNIYPRNGDRKAQEREWRGGGGSSLAEWQSIHVRKFKETAWVYPGIGVTFHPICLTILFRLICCLCRMVMLWKWIRCLCTHARSQIFKFSICFYFI